MIIKHQIRILSSRTVNQIAAGEVIESLSSVAKELVDNAIDAGATRILVETGNGWIRVSDNGWGMDQDNLILSVERHATSKLTEVDDLQTIATQGFRGEALSSIAAVSKMRLHSRAVDLESGAQLFVEGGKVVSVRPAPRQPGTTVEVNALFYNVPVRKEFQKERPSHLQQMLVKLALGALKAGMEWIHGGAKQWEVQPDESFDFRYEKLLGKPSFFSFDAAENEMRLYGVLHTADRHASNRSGEYLFVNGRAVQNRFISQAVREGYGTRLPHARYPQFAIHLNVPPHWIDVNVHPQKKEIRLREEARIGGFVMQAVERSLQKWGASTRTVGQDTAAERAGCHRADVKRGLETFIAESPVPYSSRLEPSVYVQQELSFKGIRILGVFGTSLIVDGNSLAPPYGDALLILDAQAARFRILYEQMEEKIIREEKLPMQHLLFPVTVKLSARERETISIHLDLLHRLGFGIREFGNGDVILDGLPAQAEALEPEGALRDFLDKKAVGKQELEKQWLLLLAKRSARPAASLEEGRLIVAALFNCKEPGLTPFGKPTFFPLTGEEISKRLKNS